MKFLNKMLITAALAAAAGSAMAGGMPESAAPAGASAASSSTPAAQDPTQDNVKKFLERFGYSEIITKPASKFLNHCEGGFDNATIFKGKLTNTKINVHGADMGGLVCSNSATGAMKTVGVQDMQSIARQAAEYKPPKM